MNREQRRAAKKGRSREPNKAAAWSAINMLIAKCGTADNDADAHTLLLTPAYAALDALTGTATSAPWLDVDGFIRLNEMNCFAFCLAARLHQHGTQGTKEVLAPTEKAFVDAANALAEIGTRYNKTDKYRATGDELGALREAFALLDQLVNVAPRGHTLSALIEAKGMVEKNMRAKQ